MSDPLAPGSPPPAALADCELLDSHAQSHRLGDLWAERATLVLLVRHFGCIGCSEHLALLSPRLPELADLGVRTLVVGCGDAFFIRETMHALRLRLLQAGEALIAAHPPKAAPNGGDAAFVLGVLGVASLVLTANRYGVPRLARALAEAVPTEAIADPRRLYWALLTALVYILPPLLFCGRLLPHARQALGLTASHLRSTLRLWLAFAFLASPVLVTLSHLPSFQAVYPMARGNSADALSMTAWLLAYGLQFVGVELFFRGFLLLVLRPVLGLWGVAVMLLPYTMLHFSKPPLETLGSVGFGLFLALIALRSRSILDGVGIHLILAFTLELLGLWELPRLALP